MAPHSSTLAWKIPWMEEPGRLQSIGSLRVQYDWATSLSLSCIGEGNGSPLQCSCLENPRTGELGELPSMGSHRVGHDWSDLAAAAVEWPSGWQHYGRLFHLLMITLEPAHFFSCPTDSKRIKTLKTYTLLLEAWCLKICSFKRLVLSDVETHTCPLWCF